MLGRLNLPGFIDTIGYDLEISKIKDETEYTKLFMPVKITMFTNPEHQEVVGYYDLANHIGQLQK